MQLADTPATAVDPREAAERAGCTAAPYSATCSGLRLTHRLGSVLECRYRLPARRRSDTGWLERSPAALRRSVAVSRPCLSSSRDRGCRCGMRSAGAPAGMGPPMCQCGALRVEARAPHRSAALFVDLTTQLRHRRFLQPACSPQCTHTPALPDRASLRACTPAHTQLGVYRDNASRQHGLPPLQLGSSGAAASGAGGGGATGARRPMRGIPVRASPMHSGAAGQQPCKLRWLAAAAAAAAAAPGAGSRRAQRRQQQRRRQRGPCFTALGAQLR